MKTILLIHGPNLNLLGVRDAHLYGTKTLRDIEALVRETAETLRYEVLAFQSNHEGAIVDFLQKESPKADGIIINPGALTHYSYTLYDALRDTKLPAVEVHLSDIAGREPFRKISVTSPACKKVISGKKLQGYLDAVQYLNHLIK